MADPTTNYEFVDEIIDARDELMDAVHDYLHEEAFGLVIQQENPTEALLLAFTDGITKGHFDHLHLEAVISESIRERASG